MNYIKVLFIEARLVETSEIIFLEFPFIMEHNEFEKDQMKNRVKE